MPLQNWPCCASGARAAAYWDSASCDIIGRPFQNMWRGHLSCRCHAWPIHAGGAPPKASCKNVGVSAAARGAWQGRTMQDLVDPPLPAKGHATQSQTAPEGHIAPHLAPCRAAPDNIGETSLRKANSLGLAPASPLLLGQFQRQGTSKYRAQHRPLAAHKPLRTRRRARARCSGSFAKIRHRPDQTQANN